MIPTRVSVSLQIAILYRGGSRNSSKGGGGGFRVQVRGNFHILTSKKKKKTSEGGGFKPPNPPLWIRYCFSQTQTLLQRLMMRWQSSSNVKKVTKLQLILSFPAAVSNVLWPTSTNRIQWRISLLR